MNRIPLTAALIGLAAVAVLGFEERGWTLAAAALTGGAAGMGLYHASFGFTAAWRRVVRERRGAGLRAQMLLIGLACLFTFPLMAWGRDIGLPAGGYILPMGVASAIGAFTFGIGMQLGGGCASGTLFTAGGGSTRMMVTLVFFIAGSVWATAHWDFWTSLPSTAAGISMPGELGTIPGLLLMLAMLAAIAAASAWAERRRHGALEQVKPTVSFLRGPWSLTAGAVALALVSILTMAIQGSPWGITSAYALWGGQGRPRCRRAGRDLDILDARLAAGAVEWQPVCRPDVGHEFRYCAGCYGRRGSGRQIFVAVEFIRARRGDRDHRGADDGLWRAFGVWLQHRGLSGRFGFRQPARLVVAVLGLSRIIRGHLGEGACRHGPAVPVLARQGGIGPLNRMPGQPRRVCRSSPHRSRLLFCCSADGIGIGYARFR